MRRTVYFISYILMIFTINMYPMTFGWTMRQNFNHFNRPPFQTVSSSPTVGPMFLNAKSYLTFFPKYLPIIPAPDAVFIPEPTVVTEKTATIFHKVFKRYEQDNQQPELETSLDEEEKEGPEEISVYDFNFDYDLEETTSDVFEEITNENMYDGEQ